MPFDLAIQLRRAVTQISFQHSVHDGGRDCIIAPARQCCERDQRTSYARHLQS